VQLARVARGHSRLLQSTRIGRPARPLSRSRSVSQADSASSILVTRSTKNPQASGHVHCGPLLRSRLAGLHGPSAGHALADVTAALAVVAGIGYTKPRQGLSSRGRLGCRPGHRPRRGQHGTTRHPRRHPTRCVAEQIHSAVNVVLQHVRCPTLQKWPNRPTKIDRSRSIGVGGYGPLSH